MADSRIFVRQDSLPATGEGSWMDWYGSKRGAAYIEDFFTRHLMERRGFQVRAGTITAPLTGDVDITDTAAEMCADATAAHAIMPVSLVVDIESLNGGTLPVVAAKSVATISSAGTAFLPLPMFSLESVAVTTARVQAAGAVTVTAELATTTLRHYHATIAAVGNQVPAVDKEWRMPPLLMGPRCFYVQVAGITAGPLYFAHLDYLELPLANVT